MVYILCRYELVDVIVFVVGFFQNAGVGDRCHYLLLEVRLYPEWQGHPCQSGVRGFVQVLPVLCWGVVG